MSGVGGAGCEPLPRGRASTGAWPRPIVGCIVPTAEFAAAGRLKKQRATVSGWDWAREDRRRARRAPPTPSLATPYCSLADVVARTELPRKVNRAAESGRGPRSRVRAAAGVAVAAPGSHGRDSGSNGCGGRRSNASGGRTGGRTAGGRTGRPARAAAGHAAGRRATSWWPMDLRAASEAGAGTARADGARTAGRLVLGAFARRQSAGDLALPPRPRAARCRDERLVGRSRPGPVDWAAWS